MFCYAIARFSRMFYGLMVYSFDVEGFNVTLNFARFSLISALTPMAAKYSSRKTLTNSLETSETKINVNSFTAFFAVGKSCKLQASPASLLASALWFLIVPSAIELFLGVHSRTFLFQVRKREAARTRANGQHLK